MLFPFGMIGPLYIKRRWTALMGFVLAVLVEVLQLYLKRGLFEYDDIMGNTIGMLIGISGYSLLKRIREHRDF